ncbi:UNVERIFIED_CONTAM: hypothetical protein K2H54_076977 [Gekko kuhli]
MGCHGIAETDNKIEEIRGLEKCQSLTDLSLANNRITAISGLQKLPIRTLCLKSNLIEKAIGLEELRGLRTLDLSGNRISSLEGLEEHNLLEEINLEDNQNGKGQLAIEKGHSKRTSQRGGCKCMCLN